MNHRNKKIERLVSKQMYIVYNFFITFTVNTASKQPDSNPSKCAVLATLTGSKSTKPSTSQKSKKPTIGLDSDKPRSGAK